MIGRPVARLLAPEADDYFVLKPKHSAFFATPLETLLDYLGPTTLILTGLTTDSCVSFTAADAFLRDFHVIVPEDCVTAIDLADHAQSLRDMARVMKVDVRASADLDSVIHGGLRAPPCPPRAGPRRGAAGAGLVKRRGSRIRS